MDFRGLLVNEGAHELSRYKIPPHTSFPSLSAYSLFEIYYASNMHNHRDYSQGSNSVLVMVVYNSFLNMVDRYSILYVFNRH